jgi:cephalosporin hydroxylase
VKAENFSLSSTKPATPATYEKESWLTRNRRLLVQNPRLFFQKLATWLRPMRADYRRRWSRGLRRWLIRYHRDVLFDKVSWMGLTARKMVLDAWVYQQIIHATRPEIIIEIGNAQGGSTRFLANMLDLLGQGDVIAVDIDHSIFQGHHPRIHLVTGDSSAPETLARVEELAGGRRGLVIHDGDHSRAHVLADLRAYARFVAVGAYFIVEDTIIDLFRAGDGLGSVNGPLGAVEQFVREDPRFQIDSDREYFVLTFNPRGYLKRAA